MNSLHTQAKALLQVLLPQHIRYAKYKGSTLLVPSPAQKGLEEKISQQGYPMAPSILKKTARPWHLTKPGPEQTRKDLKVTSEVQPALRVSSPYQVSQVNVFITYIITEVSKSHPLCPFPALLSPCTECREIGAPTWLFPYRSMGGLATVACGCISPHNNTQKIVIWYALS